MDGEEVAAGPEAGCPVGRPSERPSHPLLETVCTGSRDHLVFPYYVVRVDPDREVVCAGGHLLQILIGALAGALDRVVADYDGPIGTEADHAVVIGLHRPPPQLL